MKPLYLASALGLAALLAACGERSATSETAPTSAATETHGAMSGMDNMSGDMGDMGDMAMPAVRTARGTGTVKAIDKAAGTITLDHGPIAEANWPAMTMAFKAAPGLLDGVAVGDKVAFDLKLGGGSGEVTAIARQ